MISELNRLLNALGNLILGGPARKPKKPLPEILFCPVIFANGRDDDTEGLKAFFENRTVVYAGRYVPAGNHELVCEDVRIRCSSFWLRAGSDLVGIIGIPQPGAPIEVVDVSHGAHRILTCKNMHINAPVQP